MFNNKKGVVLIICYFVVIVLTILAIAFLTRSVTEKKVSEVERDSLQALGLAEAGIDRVARDLFNSFRAASGPQGFVSAASFAWFNDLLDVNPPYLTPQNVSLGRGEYSVTINNVNVDANAGWANVTLQASAVVNNVNRGITAVINFGLVSGRVFDYAYFVNNFGWLYGAGITANSDVRSNGNFAFNYNPTINGDIYASVNPDLGAAGTISGTNNNNSISTYRSQAPSSARPSNPTANPIPGNDFSYPNGYDGASVRFPNQEVLDMPYLGNLQEYKNMAISEGGTISQGGVTLVNAIYGDDPAEVGPDGISGNADDDCLVLIGTAANPIVLNGPVVIEGDVIIKGTVSGQGIIYSGRNTHILGNITYANPPTWPKPDTNPAATDTLNNTKDFLGLATKGNIIIGDYTSSAWTDAVRSYLRPPFTQAYDTDIYDATIGYDSDHNPLNGYRFTGDYTVYDGGVKDNGFGGTTSRRYYESSLSNSFIHNNSSSYSQIIRIDAVTYTNHAFAGRVGNLSENGSIICRDEAIIYSSNIRMNYDLRAQTRGDDFNLPRELAQPQRISWREE